LLIDLYSWPILQRDMVHALICFFIVNFSQYFFVISAVILLCLNYILFTKWMGSGYFSSLPSNFSDSIHRAVVYAIKLQKLLIDIWILWMSDWCSHLKVQQTHSLTCVWLNMWIVTSFALDKLNKLSINQQFVSKNVAVTAVYFTINKVVDEINLHYFVIFFFCRL
jgi:hypothetical protein